MRNALCLILLAACELEPAPKVAPKPVAAPAPAPAAVPTPPPPPAPVPAAPVQTVVEDECTKAAVRYVEVQIAEAKDAQLKTSLEMEKARTIGRIEKGCREQKWPADVIGCYKGAKTVAELGVCTKRVQPVPAAVPKKDEAKKDEPKTEKKKDEPKKANRQDAKATK